MISREVRERDAKRFELLGDADCVVMGHAGGASAAKVPVGSEECSKSMAPLMEPTLFQLS